VNCRNVPRVVELVRLLGGLESGYSRVRRPDNGFEPRLKFYGSSEAQCELLASALAELYEDGFAGSDIVVLSPRASGCCAERISATSWRDRLHAVRDAASGQIGFTTIHAFKGMEAPAIVVTDVSGVEGPAMESLFYVAVTRATDRLVVLMDESLRSTILSLLARHRGPAEAPVA
jgi:superfamily I DNA/RNA helicase